MGPRPVRLNRRPPIRYSDGALGRRCRTVDGGNKDESDSDNFYNCKLSQGVQLLNNLTVTQSL